MEHHSTDAWIVHKFGGTSVANADRYRTVAKILQNTKASRQGVVVSAMAKVTDALIHLIDIAKKQDVSYLQKLQNIHDQHLEALNDLLSSDSENLKPKITSNFEADIQTIRDLLKAVSLSRTCPESTLEMISGFGEIWSAQLLNAYLISIGTRSQWLDAREVLIVKNGDTGPIIDWKLSETKLQNRIADFKDPFLIITGYVASTHEGIATTLKRNGSDFSASIFGALLNAKMITIWTDVDGVLSADPRRVPEAIVLDEMSYQEAIELAYFGAKVIHPHTMAPALKKNIPIYIRNTFHAEHPGTKIHQPTPETSAQFPIKGFTTVDHVALLNLEGTGMMGVPGSAHRLFGGLKDIGISVIMISQGSSEHSICFAVPEAQGTLAKATVEKTFFAEIHHGTIQSVECITGVSVLAAVGENMVKSPGVAAKFFQALAKAKINVRAIAQGSSERNISVVIDRNQATRALRAAHSAFYLSAQTLSIGLIGVGTIGSALLTQIEAQKETLKKKFKIDLRVRAITDSHKMLLSEPIDIKSSQNQSLKNKLELEGQAADISVFVDYIQTEHIPHSVLIDCTSSEKISSCYAEWLKRGIHVITPNKKANSGPTATYQEIISLGHEIGSHYLYEATVGAGLPIITTLRDLILTGDEIIQIEGVLSGTLSYLFNQFSHDQSFSALVLQAKQLGYTEPDPRDDLSGEDVARKLIILAREAGLSLELADIQVESLVPTELRNLKNSDEFLNELAKHDESISKRAAEAASRDEVLRYVGIIKSSGQAHVSLKSYPLTHPFASLRGTDNILAFTTKRYQTQPLIIQGPGAGPEVTAGGVFGDLLRLSSYIGSRI